MKRDRTIDFLKGITVFFMVLAHVIQFMGNMEERALYLISFSVNATAFSAFVYAYGRSFATAYFPKGFKKALPGMVKSALRAYGAYVVSGVAFRVLRDGKSFDAKLVRQVAHLRVIPGYSEFLAAFAMLGLVGIVLYVPLKKLLEKRYVFLAVCFLPLLGLFVPYDSVKNSVLGLFIGTTRFCAFPVLQYLPFFLFGVYVTRYGLGHKGIAPVVSVLLSAIAVGFFLQNGEPSRFPPSLLWLMLPCGTIVLLELLGRALYAHGGKWAVALTSPVANMGRNSLFYLLTSNLALFALCYMGPAVYPVTRKSAKWPFNLPVGSLWWCVVWAAVLLLIIGFMTTLVRRKPSLEK